MAVLENIPGLSVTIVSCGKELTEYENADDIPSGEAAHKTVLKYVECASDELFCIKIYVKKPFKFRKGFDALLIKTYVDGKHSISEILMAKRLDKDGCFSMTVEGQLLYQLNGDALLKKFTFAPIKAVEDTDNARVEKDAKMIEGMGELAVEVYRIKVRSTKSRSSKPITPNHAQENAPLEVVEKADKGRGLSHGTSFAPAVATAKPSAVDISYADGHHNPIAVFRFKYRSKDALKKLLIIRRDPTPDPLDALSPEERDRLARQHLALLEGIKVNVPVKLEKKIKREMLTDGVIEEIDLTKDEIVVISSEKKNKKRKLDHDNAVVLEEE